MPDPNTQMPSGQGPPSSASEKARELFERLLGPPRELDLLADLRREMERLRARATL